MTPAHKASSFRSQIRLPSHCKVSWDCFGAFGLPFILTSFHGVVCSLSIGGFLSPTNHLVPFLLAAYCPKKVCALPLPSQCTGFAIAACWLCRRSVLALPSQRAVPGHAVWSSSLSAFSALQRQNAFTFLSLRSPPAGTFFPSTFRCSCHPSYSTLVQIRYGLHPADRYFAPVWPWFWHFHPSRLCKFHEKTPLLSTKALFRGWKTPSLASFVP